MLLHNIKKECEKQNISIAELERRIGVSNKSVFRWNETMPSADKLAAVAKVLGTTSEELLKE